MHGGNPWPYRALKVENEPSRGHFECTSHKYFILGHECKVYLIARKARARARHVHACKLALMCVHELAWDLDFSRQSPGCKGQSVKVTTLCIGLVKG